MAKVFIIVWINCLGSPEHSRPTKFKNGIQKQPYAKTCLCVITLCAASESFHSTCIDVEKNKKDGKLTYEQFRLWFRGPAIERGREGNAQKIARTLVHVLKCLN